MQEGREVDGEWQDSQLLTFQAAFNSLWIAYAGMHNEKQSSKQQWLGWDKLAREERGLKKVGSYEAQIFAR